MLIIQCISCGSRGTCDGYYEPDTNAVIETGDPEFDPSGILEDGKFCDHEEYEIIDEEWETFMDDVI